MHELGGLGSTTLLIAGDLFIEIAGGSQLD